MQIEEIGNIEIKLTNAGNSLIAKDLDIVEIKEIISSTENYQPKFDRKLLNKMIQKSSKNLSEITDVDEWITELRKKLK